jgi:hypothetical protein
MRRMGGPFDRFRLRIPGRIGIKDRRSAAPAEADGIA